jgi:hypothetical protein
MMASTLNQEKGETQGNNKRKGEGTLGKYRI